MLSHQGDGLKLVHAEVMGQGNLEGTTFGHAFIVDGDTVIDKSNGRDIRMPQMIYFAIGQIYNLNNYYVYNDKEFTEQVTKYGHWGPWELKTRSGL